MRYFLLHTLFFPFILFAQDSKKEVFSKRIDSKVVIDGELNESFWADIKPAKDFKMIEPTNGKIERAHQKTEVKFAYDDTGLYIGAILNDKDGGWDDPNMPGIMKELVA